MEAVEEIHMTTITRGWNLIDPEGNGGGNGLGDIDTSGGGGSCTWQMSTTRSCDCGGTGSGVAQVLILNCAGTKSSDDLGCPTDIYNGDQHSRNP